MDALTAAFVAALLAQASGRTPWLTAILASRFARPLPVVLGTALALLVVNGVAAVAGALIAPQLSPAARDLVLALALLSAAVSALWPIKMPERRAQWRIGAFATSLFGVAIVAVSDNTQLLTFAIAGRGSSPMLAGLGATLGALAVNIPAILAGEDARRAWPVGMIRIISGVLFALVGALLGLAALGLI